MGRALDLQREALRRLAGALLGDAHAAEDVVQDAFAAALARGSSPVGLGSWLRAVVRRAALDRRRRALRRKARESAVARREEVDEDASLERLELVEALARELRALDEPYRTALRLRYFDGLAPREIAARLALPLATVESRLVRALEQLRERLDRRGGRERWLTAATAWVRRPRVPWAEVVLMSTAAKVGLVAAVVGLLGWGVYRARSEERTTETARAAEVSTASSSAGAQEPGSSGREEPVVAEARTPLSPTRQDVVQSLLDGLVVDADGVPVAGVEVAFLAEGEDELRAEPRATSASDGRFTLVEPEGAGCLRASADEWFTLGAPAIGPRALPGERVLCVASRRPLEGIVVDGDGVPLADVRVEVAQRSLTLPMPTFDLEGFSRVTRSASDGRYRIDDAPLAATAEVHASRPGSPAVFWDSLGELRAAQGRIVLTDSAVLRLNGLVVDEAGERIAGAHLQLTAKGRGLQPVSFRSDAHGAFELSIPARAETARLDALCPGRQSVTIEPSGDPKLESSWPAPLVVRLEQASLVIRGRVVDEQGRALPAAWVDLLDETPWGQVHLGDGLLESWASLSCERLGAGRAWREHVNVDDQARFEIGALAPRPYRLVAFDARSLRWMRSEPILPGPDEVVLGIDTSAGHWSVSGRVVDSSGIPVAGARVTLGTELPTYGLGRSPAVTTDDEGRFAFREVSDSASFLRAEPPSGRWFEAYAFLSEFASVGEAEIVLPRVAWVQVELARGSFSVERRPMDVLGEDARGMGLESRIGGRDTSGHFAGPFDGDLRTQVFPLGDTARFLIVRHGGTQLMRIPVELKAGQLNVIRR